MVKQNRTIKEGLRFGWYIVSAIAIILIIAGILYINAFPAEIFIGMVIVLAIGVLLVLLFIMAAAYERLNLADSREALGLPPGSVRALIALILLMVFIIVGIYLFRTVGYVNSPNGILSGLTSAQVVDLGARATNVVQDEAGTYTVTLQTGITEEGARLAQQLISTIGTLVVAVAGFYFGTSAVTAARGVATPSLPVIRSIKPTEGKQAEEIDGIEISGKNFETTRTVKLILGSEEMILDDVLSSPAKIRCKLRIPSSQQVGKYELLVVNADGGEDRLPDAFEVKQKEQTS